MAKQTLEEAFTDMHLGIARTLAAICNQLIDAKALSRELLIADLVSVEVFLRAAGVEDQGRAVPIALREALSQSSALQP